LELEQALRNLPNKFISILTISDAIEDYISIDLSIHNTNLANQLHNHSTSQDWEEFIEGFLKSSSKKVAFGGYLEQRFLYERSEYFTQDNSDNKRNRHLGIDLWCPKNTGVLAPYDGVVHSFANNKNHGDYGPTIILEHEIDNILFYTLYGHLSLESIQAIEMGQLIKKGQEFACLGGSTVNGDYAPHLHFQLIKNIEGQLGDYPGVCSLNDLAYYSNNCPDPRILLNLYK
jgi:murein DD-endopeptidase MepM/ murein hydrolase activator NlpD